MRASPLLSKTIRGFTLIELLVVISIIGILAAILFPVFGAVQESGRKTKALSDERNLAIAVFNYRADYNKLPLNPDQIAGTLATGYDTVYGDPGTNALYPGYLLIDILRAVSEPKYNFNNLMNPSKTKYFDAPYVKDRNDPRSGILMYDYNDGNYIIKANSYVDPWGGQYLVWLDANHDGDLNTATRWFYTDYPLSTDAVQQGPKGTVQIGSYGKDGDIGNGSTGKKDFRTGCDDVVITQ